MSYEHKFPEGRKRGLYKEEKAGFRQRQQLRRRPVAEGRLERANRKFKLAGAQSSPGTGYRDEVGLGHKEQIALISKLWHVHGRKAESNLPVSFFSPLETIFASVSLSWYLYVHKLWSFEFYISLVIIFPCNVSVSTKFLYLLM